MKEKISAVACIVILATFATGCTETESELDSTYQALEKARAEERQRIADMVVSRMKFIRYEGSDLCFSYLLYVSSYSGGPALATLPCKDVPPGLLTVGRRTPEK